MRHAPTAWNVDGRLQGLVEGQALARHQGADALEAELQPLPPGVRMLRQPRSNLDVVVFFVTRLVVSPVRVAARTAQPTFESSY